MRTARSTLEPRHFARFRCIQADCEDTCCDGWAVPVDRETYQKYREFPDPQWRASFEKLVTIQPANSTDHDYARIRLDQSACPFLSGGLCSIHRDLGESYLPVACATFPRTWNIVDQVLEMSLNLACPEAARVTLLNPEPMIFEEKPHRGPDDDSLPAGLVDTSRPGEPGKTYSHFRLARAFVMRLLQQRPLPLWKRLLILGFFCDKLEEMAFGDQAQIPDMIAAYDQASSAGSFDVILDPLSANLSLRLEIVAELIIARITSDFTNLRFRQSYKEFMDGLEWGHDSTMEQLTARFLELRTWYFEPFLAAHGHMLEHYLVNYAHRTLFPFGPQETTSGLGARTAPRSIHEQFMLLAVYYSIIETLLVGLTGFYKEAFNEGHVIRVIYTSARTFEHSLTFSSRIIQLLEEKGLKNAQSAAVLLKA